MNKFMKKAMAAACAMAVVGGIPAAFGTEFFPSALIASAAAGEVDLDGAAVELASSITLNFYASEESLDATGVDSVVISGPNGEFDTIASGATDDGNYIIYSYDLYATQLSEPVTIQFKKGDTVVNIDGKGASYTYTVNQYCDAVEAGSYTDEEKNAAKSLKNLGIASDNYFSNKDTAVTFMDESYDLDAYAPEFATDAKISLVLDSALMFRVYIDGLAEDEAAELNYNGTKALSSMLGNNGKACFNSLDVIPSKLDEYQTITYNSKTYKASALSYCFRALKSSDVKTQNIGKAVYEYFEYVLAYALSK